MAMSEAAQFIFDSADKRVGISMIPVSSYSMILFFIGKFVLIHMPCVSLCHRKTRLHQYWWFVN